MEQISMIKKVLVHQRSNQEDKGVRITNKRVRVANKIKLIILCDPEYTT